MAKPDRSDFLLPTESGRGKVIATGITCKRVITNSRKNCELGTESTVWDDAAQTNVTVDRKGDANCVIGECMMPTGEARTALQAFLCGESCIWASILKRTAELRQWA